MTLSPWGGGTSPAASMGGRAGEEEGLESARHAEQPCQRHFSCSIREGRFDLQ